MTLPEFAGPAAPVAHPKTLTRTQAAARLGLNGPSVDKLIGAHILPVPITTASIERLAGRHRLEAVAGELTVLRTAPRAAADPARQPATDLRKWIGFDVAHTNAELIESSLRWWRCEPGRVVDNELFAVTVGTVPVAVFRILEAIDTHVRTDETVPRHHFTGQLLARISAGGLDPVYPQGTLGHLHTLAKAIMTAKVVVDSGGPIGYLRPPSVT